MEQPRPSLRVGLARVLVLAIALLAALPAGAQSACQPDVELDSGAFYRICMPDAMEWNGDLVVYAHGYVDFTEPVGIPEDHLCLGEDASFCIHEVVNGLGFGFVATSYRNNGIVLTGVEDVVDAVGAFAGAQGAPARVFLLGASEGGMITALALEQRPDVFAGGVAACGPIGDFNRQVGYLGDFRVLFDYFFPDLIPGSPVQIPPDVIATWDELWEGTIRPTVFDPANADLLAQLLRTAKAPWDMADPGPSQELTVHDALRYSVFATNDLMEKLGGQPFDNVSRQYMGSADDAALNAAVGRFAAEQPALDAIAQLLQTSGNLQVPMVALHTIKDQQVAYVQELLYGQKLRAAGTMPNRVLFPAFRYGHCNFRPWEALLSFAIVLNRVNGSVPVGMSAVLDDPAEREAFERAAERLLVPGGTSGGTGRTLRDRTSRARE